MFATTTTYSCFLFHRRTRRWFPRTLDSRGGFRPGLNASGNWILQDEREIVCTTRAVMQCAWGYLASRDPALLACVEHGFRFLRESHRDSTTGGYAWELEVVGDDGEVFRRDSTNRSYAFAFVMSAYALALSCGVEAARAALVEAGAQWSTRLWEPEHSLYADSAAPDWSSIETYRGNNANMHACEAHILA